MIQTLAEHQSAKNFRSDNELFQYFGFSRRYLTVFGSYVLSSYLILAIESQKEK